MTLNDIHVRAVNGDRRIRVIGRMRGYWYEDRVLNFVSEYGHCECTVIEETNEMITVKID